MSIASAPRRRKPLQEDEENTDRVILHAFRSREDRVVEFAVHTYRAKLYFEITSLDLLPTGSRGATRRMSLSTRIFEDFLRGVQAVEKYLRARGAL